MTGPLPVSGPFCLEALVVEASELTVLKQLDVDGHMALSLYLDLSTPEKRRRVMQRVTGALAPYLGPGSGLDEERLRGLREDLEMVRLYFKTSGSGRSPYVAIFSCAPQLFWRVYPLETPVEESIEVGRDFSLASLRQVLEQERHNGGSVLSERNLLAHLNCASV